MMAVAASHLQNIHSIESTEIKIAYATVYYRRALRHRHHEQTGREVVFLYKFREGLGSVSAVGSGKIYPCRETTLSGMSSRVPATTYQTPGQKGKECKGALPASSTLQRL